MRALRDHTSQRRSLLGGSRIWLALAAVLGVVLIASGAVRILAGARARSLLEVEVANLASDRADLEDTVLSGSVLDEAEESGGVELAIPYGGVPGPILEDLLAILESLEIRNYEYKIRERSQTVDAPDPRGDGASSSRHRSLRRRHGREPGSMRGSRHRRNGLEATSIRRVDPEAPATPARRSSPPRGVETRVLKQASIPRRER